MTTNFVPAEDLWARFANDISGLYQIVMSEIPAGDLAAADGLRYLLRYLAAGITVCIEFDDTLNPEFGSLIENRRSWGLDNPDTKYSFTRVEPGATYTIAGNPGSACELELQIDTGHFADGQFSEWESLVRWRRGAGTEPLADDGQFALTFTAPQRASYLHLREYFADWETEVPALLTIRRHGAAVPPPLLTVEEMSVRMELLSLWLSAGAQCWADLGRALAIAEPGPVATFLPPASATGLGGQAYGMGSYHCEPGEAVILELEPPACRYWSVSLATWFWESSDIANRQCSLNHAQAIPDNDGLVRFVISQDDPGVANWLDPAGHTRGTLALRALDADPDARPTLAYRTTSLERLPSQLPAGTLHLSSGDRVRLLQRRSESIASRYRR